MLARVGAGFACLRVFFVCFLFVFLFVCLFVCLRVSLFVCFLFVWLVFSSLTASCVRSGYFAEGEVCLRLKMDLGSDIPSMWDTMAYRIKVQAGCS